MTQWGSGWPADYGEFQPFGPPPAPPQPPAPPPSRWPSIALWVGVSALAVAFFPAGIGFVAVPVGVFGIVAGVIGVQAAQRAKRSPGLALTGIVLSVVAMALAAVMFFAFYRSASESVAQPTGSTLSSVILTSGSRA